jgi:hypothetical protein
MNQRRTALQSSEAKGESLATVHLVVRVPLVTKVNGIRVDTLKAHNESVIAQGRVSIAKFGNPGTRARSDRLGSQIGNGSETLLILVTKQDNRFLGYKSRLASVCYGKADDKLLQSAPAYYKELDQLAAKLWFTVIAPFEPVDLSRFSLASNQRPLLEVMQECRTASLLVEENY